MCTQFCADVQPGNARAKECLEDNREQPGFSAGCKSEIEKMMESRAADFRLDPKLRQLCADDIQARRCARACFGSLLLPWLLLQRRSPCTTAQAVLHAHPQLAHA
jgi:hypothetical protein